ncbi:nucleotide exchange factor GrpE [uncultured Roseivirga sp.]|uniref:nucleotide exchange factor GrpE n=1 Tax=uncultured Roseivirga sp. TaxID=543088 RepID=UPI0030DD5C9E|tara:strand:- start:65645 stop:66277 length:633 start_codon:yes stop_codon:yes gene_type:complete
MARIRKMFSAFLKTDKESMKKKNKAQENEEVVNENVATEEAEKDETAEAQNEEIEEPIELTAEEKLTIEVAEAKDKYLRLYSEFENFRRRNAKERIELIKTASQDLMADLIPTIDDFERAQQANQKQEDIEAVKEGFELIHKKLLKTLESKGLKLMNTEKGTAFDADLHEAVTQFPVEEEELKGKIIDTVEKGYFLGEKVVRFAKVVIGA